MGLWETNGTGGPPVNGDAESSLGATINGRAARKDAMRKPHKRRKFKQITVSGKKMQLHRHLMEMHLGRKLERHEVVHHKNDNPLDNRIENLEVMTLSDHTRHHNWARTAHPDEQVRGPQVGTAKLTTEEVVLIKEALASDHNISELARLYGVSRTNIRRIRRGEIWSWI